MTNSCMGLVDPGWRYRLLGLLQSAYMVGVVISPCSSVVEHSLGKGEAGSSILPMGTMIMLMVCRRSSVG